MSNDIVAQAHLENKTIELFTHADTQDRSGVFNKNVTKSFYSASLLFEVLTQFGEQNDECKVMQRYSKWKATYLHKCLQTGETPLPGPQGSGFEDELGAFPGGSGAGGTFPGGSGAGGAFPGGSGGGGGASGYDPNMPSSSGAGPSTSGGDIGFDLPSIPGSSGGFADLPSVPTNVQPPPSFNQPPQQPQPPPQPQQQPQQPSQPIPSGPLKEPHEIDLQQVEKLCKFAVSALQYEDVKTAADNLRKALTMITR